MTRLEPRIHIYGNCDRKGLIDVLVIDDDKGFGRLLCRYMEISGFTAITAKTGGTGLDLARRCKPKLIFLDLCLGFHSKRSGTETLRMLKAQEATRNIPVIAMSGILEGPEDEAQVRGDGADEFMTKVEIAMNPGGRQAFLRRVSALLMFNEAGTVFPPAFSKKWAKSLETASNVADQGPILKNQPGLTFTVLVIDDEEETAELVKLMFHKQPAYRVLSARDGTQGLRMAAGEFPDLIIVDLMLPGIPGQEVCRRLREQEKTFYIPILVLTADMRMKQEINCINLGADDYLAKPANPSRLMARIRALIRRFRFRGNSKGVIKAGAVSLDLTSHLLTAGHRKTAIALTPIESGLCALLMSAEGRFVDKKVLFKKLYNSWPPLGSAAVKSHISNLRRKLGKQSKMVASHKDAGYRFNVEYASRLNNL